MTKCTVIACIRVDVAMLPDDGIEHVRSIIIGELEGACREHIEAVKERIGALSMEFMFRAY